MPVELLGFEAGGNVPAEAMAQVEIGMPPEVRQPLPLLFSHVIAVGLIAGGHCVEPLGRA